MVLVLIVSGIPLLIATVSSLLLSALQAATSVQEQCSLYLLKLISLLASIYLFADWFLRLIIDFIKLCISMLSLNFIS